MDTAATAVGATAAILIGGWLAQYSDDPTHLAFWVELAGVLVLLGALFLLPETPPTATGRRPLLTVPAEERRLFRLGTASVAAAFMTGAVFLALGAQIIRDLAGTTDAFLAAATLATWPVTIVPTTFLARRLSSSTAAQLGGVFVALGFALLLLASTTGSLALFLGSAVLSGVGYGSRTSLRAVPPSSSERSRPAHR